MQAKTLGYIAAGLGVPLAIHLGFDSKLIDGHSVFELTNSAARFLNYGISSLAFGKAIQAEYEAATGRKANFVETIGANALGAMAATGLWEGWENVGSQIGAIYNALHGTFGEYAKQNFPGSGMESFTDAAYTVAGTTALATAAEGLSKGRQYVSKKLATQS